MRGDAIEKQTTLEKSREAVLTEALCRALIVKKGVDPERFAPVEADDAAFCPRDCHACCSEEVVLDLTSVESLMIYLLNRDVVHLIDEYTASHDPTGYCRFMIMDRCIINAYKPSACQMYMPVAHHGELRCFYLADPESRENCDNCTTCTAHSNSYAIHGYMLMVQQEMEEYLSQSCFKNAYEGTRWWQIHYEELPGNTRQCLDAIVEERDSAREKIEAFSFEQALAAGNRTYNQAVQRHRARLGN